MVRLLRGKGQRAVFDRKISAGGNDVDMVAADHAAIDRFADVHRGMIGQQVDHHALVGRIEMLNDDERHARGG